MFGNGSSQVNLSVITLPELLQEKTGTSLISSQPP